MYFLKVVEVESAEWEPAEVSLTRGRSVFCEGPKCLARGRSVFSRGVEVEGAEVAGAEVSNPYFFRIFTIINFIVMFPCKFYSCNVHLTDWLKQNTWTIV